MDALMVKTCKSCGGSKSLTEFDRKNDRKDGCDNRCKACISAYRKKLSNKSKSRQNSIQFRAGEIRHQLIYVLQMDQALEDLSREAGAKVLYKEKMFSKHQENYLLKIGELI